MSDTVTLQRSTFLACVRSLIVGALGLMVLGGVGGYYASTAGDADRTIQDANQRSVAAVAQAKGLGEQIVKSDVCQSTSPEDLAQFGYLCDTARKVVSRPTPDPVDTQALASAVTTLVMAGVRGQIETAVARYLAEHPPPASVSQAEIARMIAAELARNPPADGAPGESGQPGGPGRPPTPDEVNAAVAAWFAAHPPNECSGRWESYLYPDGVSGYRCVVPS
jgi:hypothetical protein